MNVNVTESLARHDRKAARNSQAPMPLCASKSATRTTMRASSMDNNVVSLVLLRAVSSMQQDAAAVRPQDSSGVNLPTCAWRPQFASQSRATDRTQLELLRALVDGM